MAKQKLLTVDLNQLTSVLVGKGILPAGTTNGSSYAYGSTLKTILTNDAFDDLPPGTPIPDAGIDVPAGIDTLS
jgi:hypothetical protein